MINLSDVEIGWSDGLMRELLSNEVGAPLARGGDLKGRRGLNFFGSLALRVDRGGLRGNELLGPVTVRQDVRMAGIVFGGAVLVA